MCQQTIQCESFWHVSTMWAGETILWLKLRRIIADSSSPRPEHGVLKRVTFTLILALHFSLNRFKIFSFVRLEQSLLKGLTYNLIPVLHF